MNKERVGSSETPPLCCEPHCRCRETRQEIARAATGGRIVAFFKHLRLIEEHPVEIVRSGTWTERDVEKINRYLDDRRMVTREVAAMIAGRPF